MCVCVFISRALGPDKKWLEIEIGRKTDDWHVLLCCVGWRFVFAWHRWHRIDGAWAFIVKSEKMFVHTQRKTRNEKHEKKKIKHIMILFGPCQSVDRLIASKQTQQTNAKNQMALNWVRRRRRRRGMAKPLPPPPYHRWVWAQWILKVVGKLVECVRWAQ